MLTSLSKKLFSVVRFTNFSLSELMMKVELLIDNDNDAQDLIDVFSKLKNYYNFGLMTWACEALYNLTPESKDAYIETLRKITTINHVIIDRRYIDMSMLFNAYMSNADERIIDFIINHDKNNKLFSIIYSDKRFYDGMDNKNKASALELIDDCNMTIRMIPKSVINYLYNHNTLNYYYPSLIELAYNLNRMNTDAKYYDDIMSTVSADDMMNDIDDAYADYQYEIDTNEYVNYKYYPYDSFNKNADYSHQDDDALYVLIMMLMNETEYMMEDFICYSYIYSLYMHDYGRNDSSDNPALKHNLEAMKTYAECIMNGYPSEFAYENTLIKINENNTVEQA